MTYFLKNMSHNYSKDNGNANLIKFNQVQMLGGTTLNGEVIFQQAQEEINKIEEEIRSSFETPIDYMVG